MKRHRTANAPDLLLRLDPTSPHPRYRQLYGGLRDAILTGRLAPGTHLPSSRVLAADLQIARNTVTLAFEQLRAEGYVEGNRGAGTRVTRTLPATLLRMPPQTLDTRVRPTLMRPLSARGAALVATAAAWGFPTGTAPTAFRFGTPAIDEFPSALWARLTARRWKRAALVLAEGQVAGYTPLRQEIAAYVTAVRGVRCTSEQVLIVNGSQQALDLAARVLLDPGDAVWVENPGYLGARGALASAGARLVPVPVDGEGLSVETGIKLAPHARLVYVSPSHQYPLGVTMSAARRLALLSWASRADAWVLEDDYDSEFRYTGRPLACLQGLDVEGRVLYLGTFSKTLLPALRLGYIIVPEGLVDAFLAARAVADRHSPTLEQAVLADFIAEGHFTRHVRRMRTLYAERQACLLEAARRELDGVLELAPADAGMHLVGWLPHNIIDRDITNAAAALGVEVLPLSRYAMNPLSRGALLLGYAGFNPAAIRSGVIRLAAVLRQARKVNASVARGRPRTRSASHR